MKKSYKSTIKAFVMLLSILSLQVSSQNLNLTGLMTINSGQATQTLTPPYNFQTFTDFANTFNLTTNTVSGVVTVDVVPNSGPYNQQIQLNQFTGTSSSNRVIIEGNGNLLYFNSSNSGQPWTLALNGTDYLTVNNLNIQAQGVTYQIGCILSAGADYNTFSSCTFSVNANTTASSSYCTPFSISSSLANNTGGSNSGNYNTAINCQMFSGYFGCYVYGLTGAPFQQGNRIMNCAIQDFYVYGLYFYYQDNGTVSNNVIERPTRTTLTTFYGCMIYYNQGTLCEGNIVQKPAEQNPNASISAFMYYWYSPRTPIGAPNIYRNNIARNIRCLGTAYGAYCYYASGQMYHNTFSFDDKNATGAQTIYGIYTYYTSTYGDIEFKNNLITISRTGTGTRYGLFVGLAGAGLSVASNNVYVSNNTSATNYLGNYNGTYSINATAAWIAAADAQATFLDPMYVNANTDNHPTNLAMDNTGSALGVVFDQQQVVRYTPPDRGALEFNTPICAATPTGVTISGANYTLCPGQTASLSLGNFNSAAQSGITYNWQSSTTSSVGPWTQATGSGSTGLFYTTPPVTLTTYYQLVMTCTNPGGGAATPVVNLQIASITTNVVNYNEGFEGLGINNRLPNCSWSASSLGNLNTTYTASASGNRVPNNGSGFASFSNNTPGTSYYYSNGIYMVPGITYSAGTWWATQYLGSNNWSNLSVLVGASQTPTGLTPVASVGPAISGTYKLLGGTFTVSTPGFYYVAIRATGMTGSAQYLSIDDVFVNIPCAAGGSVNAPALNVSASANTVCAGVNVNISATGANSYTWNTGSNASGISVAPTSNTSYTVWGKNATTGCVAEKVQLIVVNQQPNMSAYASPPLVCAGSKVYLAAQPGNNPAPNSFTWIPNVGTGSNNAATSTTVTAATNFTVYGKGSNGCISSVVVPVSVNAVPSVTAYPSPGVSMCAGESVTLQGVGAVTYQFSSPNYFSQSNNAVYIGSNVGTQTITVTGTDASGCTGSNQFLLIVNACPGLNKVAGNTSEISVYPNPSNAEFNIQIANGLLKSVQVLDLTGKVIMIANSENNIVSLNLSQFASGLYFANVKSSNGNTLIKLIKE